MHCPSPQIFIQSLLKHLFVKSTSGLGNDHGMKFIQTCAFGSTIFIPIAYFLATAIPRIIEATRSVEFDVAEFVIYPGRMLLVGWAIKSQTIAIISAIMIGHVTFFIKATITSIISTSFVVQVSIAITIHEPSKFPWVCLASSWNRSGCWRW